eukprot:TRINITY_DN18837_c0_g1_i1.p1 TRINITY_DN18837_c0_g1~~TRINITY_DN18837_c0_g1_i1.p1  ORF type:complete len:726 (-),score=148.65 TRINITY_DN18837_c0_g1_i1:111-2288(-)
MQGYETPEVVLELAHSFRDACQRGRWTEAEAAAVALATGARDTMDTSSNICNIGGSRSGELLWVAGSSARAGLLQVLVAFAACRHTPPPPNLSLAAAAACTALLPEAWPSGAADDLLGMSGIVGYLLRAAAPSNQRLHSSLHGFAALRARRAAAELLAALLESSSPTARQTAEASLLREAGHAAPMQALIDALLGSEPDPRLNEACLELLWRGLRRVAPGAGLQALASAHPALLALEGRRTGLSARLQALAPDQLLADARGLALELAVPGAEPAVYACRGAGGPEDWANGECGVAVFSRYCLGLHQDGEMDPSIELPWEASSILDVRPVPEAEAGFGQGSCGEAVFIALSLNLELLQRLGCLPQDAVLLPTLELLLDAPLHELQALLSVVRSSQLHPEAQTLAHMPLLPLLQPEFYAPQMDARETPVGTSAPVPLPQAELYSPQIDVGETPVGTPCQPASEAHEALSPARHSVVSVSDAEAQSPLTAQKPGLAKPPWKAAAVAAKQAPAAVHPKAVGNRLDAAGAVSPKRRGAAVTAADLLGKLFGSRRHCSTKGEQPRGYGALPTGMLQALCKVRGLPPTADRQKLIASLEGQSAGTAAASAKVSVRNQPKQTKATVPVSQPAQSKALSQVPAHNQSALPKAAAPSLPAHHHQSSSEAKKAPQDAVGRVLQEASRLAREVAEVQRQFRESKRATSARSGEADALLRDIAKAGTAQGRPKRSRGN